jgi:cystathionine gamma-synthase/methionine-gamma-lyase
MEKHETAGRAAPGLGTRAVHAGRVVPLHGTQPTNVPIYASTTFLSPDAAGLDGVLGETQPGYVYARYANPTVTAVEQAVAALDGAAATVAFGSGMAALHAALLLCEIESGSVVLAGSDLYGASHTLLSALLGNFRVETRFVDMTDPVKVWHALKTEFRPRAMLFEPISNPLIKVADVPTLCELARREGAISIVDSTFSPPPLLQPLAHGADIVIHSATKYLSGHGDVSGGFVSVADPAREARLRQIGKLAGAVLGPFEAYLIGRGLKTLVLRVRRQCENAAALAEWLGRHPRVSRVHYPAIRTHPQHGSASRLLASQGWSAMLAFEIRDAAQADIFRLFDAFRLILPATTLGDVYTEVSYPPMSSHRGWAPAQMRRAGITPGLVRVSAGIEDVGDIIADLEQALAKI